MKLTHARELVPRTISNLTKAKDKRMILCAYMHLKQGTHLLGPSFSGRSAADPQACHTDY